MFSRDIFAERVKKLRKEKKVSQAYLAKLLGVTSTQITDIEKGKTTTSIERLCILAEYFDVSVDYLVGQSNIKERR